MPLKRVIILLHGMSREESKKRANWNGKKKKGKVKRRWERTTKEEAADEARYKWPDLNPSVNKKKGQEAARENV